MMLKGKILSLLVLQKLVITFLPVYVAKGKKSISKGKQYANMKKV